MTSAFTIAHAVRGPTVLFVRHALLPGRCGPPRFSPRCPVRAVVTVRQGRYADAAQAAKCMAAVFRIDKGALKLLSPFYTFLAYLDLTGQLCKRLPRNEEVVVNGTRSSIRSHVRSKSGLEAGPRITRLESERRSKHVLLVAEDPDEAPNRVIGCVEMGIVDVPRLITNGILDEMEQWGRPLKEGESDGHIPATANENGSIAEQGKSDSKKRKTVSAPYIGNLSIVPEYQRRGIASKLVSEAEKVGLSWGFNRVCLHVDAENAAAKSLYAKLGYTCSIQEPKWYRRIGRVRRLFLTKELGGSQTIPVDINLWDEAQVSSTGQKLNIIEYLRLCYSDLLLEGKRAR